MQGSRSLWSPLLMTLALLCDNKEPSAVCQQKFRTALKALGHVAVNKPVISIIYIVVHTWPLCSTQILVDGVNPLESCFQKSTNISAIVQHMSVSFVSRQSSRVHVQSSTVILRNKVEDLCDTAYQKYCKIVISKVCLYYVTLPL